MSAVVARQIAAIAATVDSNGLFGAASKVSGITADVIGFETNRDGFYENTTGINQTSPSAAKAIDGFILASAISGVNTQNNTRTAQFEFVA